MSALSRRGILGTVAGIAAIGAAVPAMAASLSPDAELVHVCHRFAEAEFDAWYLYCTTPEGEQDRIDQADWATVHWIVATPATTPEGWHAKALAYAAWSRDAYDDSGDQDGCSPVLASLLRNMVAPARDAIIARLTVKYGPLPDGYTANGMWIVRSVEA